MRSSNPIKRFDEIQKFNERFLTFVGIVVAVIFVLAVYMFVEERSCTHPRYVKGTECHSNGDLMICKDTMVYDGCNDR